MGKRVSRVTMQSQRSANARVHGMSLFVFTFLLYDDVCTQLIYGVARSLLGVAFSVSGTLPSPERIVLEKQNTNAMAPMCGRRPGVKHRKTHAASENWPKSRAWTQSKRQTLRRRLSLSCKIVI